MSKHTNRVIEYLIQNPQPNLEFAINTNACPPKETQWKDFVDKIKILEDNNCIKRFVLFVSAEGKGAQQEYNRYGMDWTMFTDNVKYYLKQTTGRCVFMSAFNVLSIPTFLPFLKYVARLKGGYENEIVVDIPYVRSPGFLDAKIASDELIKEYLHPCIPYMEEKNFNNREKAQMKRIVKDLDLRHANSDNWEQEAIEGRRMFYEWIQQYDKRRNVNFLEVFPQMKDFYKECKKCMI